VADKLSLGSSLVAGNRRVVVIRFQFAAPRFKHGEKIGGTILPEMMRWLWRDHEFSSDPSACRKKSVEKP
jgi:hypothetical protein